MTDIELKALAAEEKRRYMREWKRAHPEEVKAARERYWIRKALKRLEEEKNNKGVTA